MVIRIFYFVIAIFSVAMVYMTLQDPYYSEILKPDNSIATIGMNDVVDYEINATIVSAKYEADEWNRYKNMDEFLNFRADVLRDDTYHSVISDKAFYQDDTIKLKGNVRYLNSENLKFVSEEADYNTKTKIASSSMPFVMTKNEDKIVGNSLVYDANLKRTYAKGIQAWVQEKR
ncbi:LPS export ABC transporter periplasmic protein LptC [Campylobacter sp. RM16187]|uniref:LPS export ABC transporter periplasmic protein LptC n=1 Tax=Campylobacter sp. RM16187 TaxID=1660063 RepID=UPI0021B59733|nr:LPS export ABC transporter periplasmic protein LptC [Campylobacter sp. RM16187]QKG28961.1 putative lipooligosaccharide transport system, substrate-binding component (LptC family) [Campylobacter sp. RM16187]